MKSNLLASISDAYVHSRTPLNTKINVNLQKSMDIYKKKCKFSKNLQKIYKNAWKFTKIYGNLETFTEIH